MTGAALSAKEKDSDTHQKFIHLEAEIEGQNPKQRDYSPKHEGNNNENAVKSNENNTNQFLDLGTSSNNGLLNSDEPLAGAMRETRGDNKETALMGATTNRDAEINAEKIVGEKATNIRAQRSFSRSQTEPKSL